VKAVGRPTLPVPIWAICKLISSIGDYEEVIGYLLLLFVFLGIGIEVNLV
jgi:hypothetical protein